MSRLCAWVLLFVGVLLPGSWAQQPKANPAAFADEPTVTERYDTVYRYNADGTGSKLDTRVVRIQKAAGLRSFGVLSVVFRAGYKRVEYVSVKVHKRGGQIVTTPPGEAQDQAAPATRAAPAYSEIHAMLLAVRGLAVGDTLEYQVRTVFTQPEVKDQFWGAETFDRGRVVLERTVELHVPATRSVQVSSPKYPPEVSTEKGDKIYRWTGSQRVPTVKQTANGADASPADAPAEDSDTGAVPIAWTTFASWAEVGTWYRSLTGPPAPPTAEVKARANQVVYGARTPEAKIRALYAFVAQYVRSIDVPFGQGAYAPQSAEDTLNNLYGDGKDKAELLATMLRAEGLPASTVLAGGNEVDPKLPLPAWFNRVLVLTGDRATGEIWLDPLPEVAPFRVLQPQLRDRLALVIPLAGDANLRRTPADLPFASVNRWEAAGEVSSDGALQAHVDLTLRGDEELQLRQALHNNGPAEYDQTVQFFLQTKGLRGTVSDTAADGIEKLDQPLRVSFDLGGTSFGDWNNFRIVPPEPALNFAYAERKSAPAGEIRLGGKRTEISISKLSLPGGFSADLPAALHLHTAFANLDQSYKLEKSGALDVVVTERTFAVQTGSLPASAWPEYRKFLDGVRDSEPWIQLTSVGTGGMHRPPSSGENLPAAAELVAKAEQAMEAKDWKTATDELDRARVLNSRQAFLWSGYGVIAETNGKRDEAIEDYRRELKEHPGEDSVSQRLATLLAQTGKTAEAAAVLRGAVAINPQDTRSVFQLGSLLAQTDRGAAEKVLRAGLEASPANVKMKIGLGTLLVEEGKRDEGAGLLTAAATSSSDPGELNDAAYGLAEAGVNLPGAEQASRRSIQLLNVAGTQRVNFPDEDARLHYTLQLTASWDTYGWVLLKEGDVSEAEPWLRAGWLDSYGSAAGDHYGSLLQKQGRGVDASRVLRLASQGERGDATETSVTASSGRGRLKRGAPSAGGPVAGTGLKAERNFAVPRAAGVPNGTAVFDLDYALNLPSSAVFVSGDSALSGMADALGKVDTHTIIPTGSPAHITRRAVLRCGAGPGCTLEVLPGRAALAQ